jgi:6-phosphogluconolactonase
MSLKYNLQVYPTVDQLNRAAAAFIIDLARKATELTGRFVISLSGGNTPGQLYALLAQPPFLRQMPWTETYIFWGDERCVPLEDKRNNAHMALSVLLNKTEIPPSNIYRMQVDLPPDKAAVLYEKKMKEFFEEEAPRFDLVLLGLGEHGHTASLFPGTPVIHEKAKGIRKVYVEEQNEFRITMTAPLINLAHHILFLVTGESKAEVLKTIFTAPYQPDIYPAQLINPQDGQLVWFADKQATALVEENK